MSNDIFNQYGNDPITLFQAWYDEAAAQEPNDPEAICLATADKNGRPSARMVLLKECSPRGFKFHSNAHSHKGQDILDNPQASFCLYWKSTRKQIRVSGTVQSVSPDESDAYFATRPRARAIGAWASQQSQGFDHEDDLAKAVAFYEDKFKDADVIPRPDYWQGFLIVPDSIEFWIGNKDRLHTRFIYHRENTDIAAEDSWQARWLYP